MSATPPMATRGSRPMATGLVLTMIAVGAGVSSAGGFALLLSFAGVLSGAGLIFFGIRIRIADDPTAPIGRPGVIVTAVHVRALVHCLRRNLALVGLVLASAAATATADTETGPVLCFSAFVLLLLGLSLLNVGIVLLGEQQH